MTTLYKILTGIVSILAITVCIMAYLIRPEGTALVVIGAAVGLSILSALVMIAVWGLEENPRSDKSVRR